MLYATAMRRSEIIALDLSDVDFVHAHVIIRHGKGGHQRIVPLIPSALVWSRRYQEIRHLLTHDFDSAFFLSCRRHRIAGSLLERVLRLLSAETGIKPLSCHMFRHSCAAHLMEAGAPIPYIQALLGHRCIETTRRYLRVITSHLRDSFDRAHPRDRWDLEDEFDNI